MSGPLQGVFTALVTPFAQDGSVDLSGLRRNIRQQIEHGVAGIVPLGTTGEAPTLSAEERDAIIRASVEEAAGAVPVMVGTGTNCTRKTIEETKRAKDLGADLALIVTPYYNKPTQAGILAHYEAIAAAVDLPIVQYNIKGRTALNVESGTMRKLADIPGVIAVKEASGDIQQIADVIAEVQEARSDFSVLSGDDGITLPLIALGGRGVVSVISNLMPAKVVALVQQALEGDFSAARRVLTELRPLLGAAFIETNPGPIKYMMNRAGYPAGGLRLPLVELSESNQPIVLEALERAGLVPAAGGTRK